MTSLHPARRRAERFDDLVEAHRLDVEAVDARTAELLELVGALRAVPEPQARPEFVSDLREQLLLAARTELTAAGAPRRERAVDDVSARLTVKPRRTRRERRVGIAIGAIAIVGATSSMAVASQGALPGDPLYPVKRAIESTQAGFTVSDAAKGRTMLGDASDRLGEVRDLSSRDDVDAALVRSTLGTFSDQASQGSDLLMSDYEREGHRSSVEQVHAFTARSMRTLGELEAVVPDAARPALLDAAQVLFTIDAAAEQVCPGCSGDGITEIPAPLLASSETTAEEPGDTVAARPLEGTQPTASASPEPVSGADPPADPLEIPTQAPLPPHSLAPTETTSGQGEQQQGTQQQQSGNGNQQQQDSKPKPAQPTDLAGVTQGLTDTVNGTVGAVNDVVGGVVQGVTGLLGGLTSGLLGGQSTPPAP